MKLILFIFPFLLILLQRENDKLSVAAEAYEVYTGAALLHYLHKKAVIKPKAETSREKW